MTAGVAYALLSLCCSGITDVIFKKYSAVDRSRGMYLCLTGVVWAVIQVSALLIVGKPVSFDSVSVLFGVAAGIALTISNLLLLECYTHIDISLGSTIYRLNTIVVIILSFWFLNESLGVIKLTGISLGIIAVCFLYRKPTHIRATSTFTLFFCLAILAAIMRAVYGVSTKKALLEQADPKSMLVIIALCWIVGGLIYAIGKEKRFRLTQTKVAYSAVSGSLVFLIVNFLMLAVENGEASVVIPIANMSFVVALLISLAVKMERLTMRKALAVLIAISSIAVLSRA